MKKYLRIIIPILLLLLIILAIAWWYTDMGIEVTIPKEQQAPITASGTIEATQIIMAPETRGVVLQVLAEEGDQVKAGQIVVRLGDSLFQAQWDQAKAALKASQANYNLVAAGPTDEERQVAIASAELELLNAEQTLDDLYENHDIAKAQAKKLVKFYEKAVKDDQQHLDDLKTPVDPSYIELAKTEVTLAKDDLEQADDAYDAWADKPEDNMFRAQLLRERVAAQKRYDAAVDKLDDLESTPSQKDIALAEAELALSKAQLEQARQNYDKLKDGPDPDTLALAQTNLSLAQAHLAAAQAEPSPEQLAAAQAQVDTAQASLEVIQAQMDKLVLKSPIDGIVVSKSVEPGEVVLPGASLMTLARLDELTITVYISEDRYGEIILGQHAEVTVDSFPGEIFDGVVIYIADQAEFTPRNVQTAEGRRTTVFAIKLAVEDTQRKLKPGMPADVKFVE